MSKSRKSKGVKISYTEPAVERPITIALSHGEMLALIKHHEKQIKATTRNGVKAVGTYANNAADIHRIRKHVKETIDAHAKRGKGLGALLSQSLEK